jgi:hypothetical protein
MMGGGGGGAYDAEEGAGAYDWWLQVGQGHCLHKSPARVSHTEKFAMPPS